MEVADGPAIRDDIAFEAPFVAQRVKEKVIRARRLAAYGVVSAHDRIGMGFHDGGAKRGRVGVREIVEGNRHVEAMPQNFGAAVDGNMFGCRNCFQIIRVVALQAAYEGHSDAAGQVRIFDVGFLAATTAWLANNIYVRRPTSEA